MWNRYTVFRSVPVSCLCIGLCLGIGPSIVHSRDHSTGIATSGREIPPDRDKCGYRSADAQRIAQHLEDKWGYGYDSLLTDLDRWAASPWGTVGSIGTSVRCQSHPYPPPFCQNHVSPAYLTKAGRWGWSRCSMTPSSSSLDHSQNACPDCLR